MTRVIDGPALVTFVGGMEGGPATAMVGGAHCAIALDLVAAAQASGAYERIIVLTNSPALAAQLPSGVIVEPGEGPFHFGGWLQDVIHRHRLRRPVYVSRGALPYFGPAELADIAARLAAADSLVVTNNLFSADLIAFTPGDAIDRIPLPPIDNPLARLLQQEGGVPADPLERTTKTQFDVDSPTDLLIMKVHPGAGERTARYLESLELDTSRVEAAKQFFSRLGANVTIMGRVGSPAWARLERDTLCRVRMISEERGMKADEREGMARSLFGLYLEAVGPEQAFADLGVLGDCAFIDSRVLFAHLSLDLSMEDRFQSDLGNFAAVENPLAAAITRAAMNAPVPVVLGGHSLVSGGLYALVDASWGERERQHTWPPVLPA